MTASEACYLVQPGPTPGYGERFTVFLTQADRSVPPQPISGGYHAQIPCTAEQWASYDGPAVLALAWIRRHGWPCVPEVTLTVSELCASGWSTPTARR